MMTQMVDQADAMRLHLQEQISLYGEQNLVSLVNHKGYEQPIKEAYEKYVAKVCTIYVALYPQHTMLSVKLNINLSRVKY